MTIRHLIALLLVTLLAACGGGQANTDVSAGAATRIEIAPNALLLTATGQKKLLAAKVFDAAGNTVQTQVEWTSSHPENIAVDASGAVTAISDGGSSQIIARIGTVQSPPLLAVHTQLPAGAVLLTDANIVGEPEETTPGAVASMDNTYQVQLTGVPPPAVGSLLINTEGKVVAGRVRAVQTTSGVHLVTLALAPAREMFPQLNINEVIDLNQAEVAIPTEIQAQYDVQRQGNTFSFTPKPGQVSLTASLIQKQPMSSGDVTSSGVRTTKTAAATAPTSIVEFKRGPFKCKSALDGAAGAGSQIIALTRPPLFEVTLNPKLDILFTAAHGPERFVIHSEPTVAIEAGLTALIAMEGKVTCEVEFLVIKIPFGGPVALVVGGQLPVGAGVEIGGKITAANLSLSAKATAKTTADIGFVCPAGTNCAIVNQVGKLDVSFTPTVDAPGFEDVRFEPSLSVYAFVKASIGNPFLKSLRFDAFKVKAGPALKGNFAPQSTQIADPVYQSNYKLMAEIKAGADTEFIGLAAFFGLNNVAENLIEIPFEIATTPIGAVTADKAQFVAGDTVNFKVKLDPTKTDFLPVIGPYNVQRILLVRHSPTVDAQTVGSVDASSGQTEFDLSFTGIDAGKADEFHAFVVTKLLPFDLFALELGSVTASSVDLALGTGQSHTCALTSTGGVKCWGENFFGQLGSGGHTDQPESVPTDVSGLSRDVAGISLGANHSCALTKSGGVKCWGANGFGQVGDGSNGGSLVPLDVSGLTRDVLSVSAGGGHTCALTGAGGVRCWGRNFSGQLGSGSTSQSLVLSPVDVSGMTSGVIAVSAGGSHSCALTSVGGVRCWGSNLHGQLGNGSTTDSLLPVDVRGLTLGVVAIGAGNNQTCALTSLGGVQCWGENSVGQLGDGSTTSRSVPGGVIGLSFGVAAIDVSQFHNACALTNLGAVRCWGENLEGEFGNGSTAGSLVPVNVSGLSSDVVAIAVGFHHVCAAVSTGGVKCWGRNFSGQLGTGDVTDRRVPADVIGFP